MKQQFKVGDKVIALSTTTQPEFSQSINKGTIYTVLAVKYCSGCGGQKINVVAGLPQQDDHYCLACKTSTSNEGRMWSTSKRFAPVEDLEEVLATAVENEDYELAHILTQK